MASDENQPPTLGQDPTPDDLRGVLDEVLGDVGRFRRILRRAFPAPAPEEDEVRGRLDRMRRAAPEPGLEPLQTSGSEPTAEEREAASLQAAAKGQHTLYALTARHMRNAPFVSDWVGHCQAVRVTLPATTADAKPIWTHLGVVERSDHLMFSIAEVVAGYVAQFGTTPTVERLDLITGARHLGLDRFSPISIFLAYERVDATQPSFYVLESGSAQGKPEVLYYAPDMPATILAEAGFAFTPFACKDNWYTGKLTMDRTRTEPSLISISIAQEKDGQRHYLDLSTSYAVEAPGHVIWPVMLQAQAALRVFAIAQGMGCDLDLWESALGDVARCSFDWISKPPRKGTPEGYSGCSKVTSVPPQ